jgi:hypothetical protein
MQNRQKASFLYCVSMAILVAVLALFAVPQRLEADLVVVDDDMSDFTKYSFASGNSNGFTGSNPDDISFVDFQFLSEGGNGFFSAIHNHDVQRDGIGNPVNGNGMVELYSFFTYLPRTYTPSVSGSIETISFSLDIRFEEGDFDRVFFFAEEGTTGYLGGSVELSTLNDWQTITVDGLTEADFSGLNFSGSMPLSFGFGFISSVDVSSGPLSSTISADNFRVSLTAVPEPGSLTLLTLFTGCALLRRRRA